MMMCRTLLAASALAAVLASPALAQDKLERAPAPSATSQIWLDPALPGTLQAERLAARGYVREEYFLSGTGNVYGYGPDGKVRVDQADVPYVTRVIVLRPSDREKFSGNVHLNPFHPYYGAGTWDQHELLAFEKGDAFVGVMIGADAATRRMVPGPSGGPTAADQVLKWFNPERYARISVPETGLAWDIFADTARLIRENALLGELRPTHVYAMGGSFTGSFLRTYINSGFHTRYRRAGGRPLIDGYLITVSSPDFLSGFNPLNSKLGPPIATDGRRRLIPIDAPVIELLSENEAQTNKPRQVPDKDKGPGAHRLYEMIGVTHAAGPTAGGDSIMDQQLASRGAKRQGLPDGPCSFPMTDILMVDYVRSALDNLDIWVRKGTPPPRAPRYAMVDGKPQRDANGNVLGGLRPVQIELPLAAYGEAPAGSGCDTVKMFAPMRRVPLSQERLKALYPGGRAEYLRRFDAAVDRRVRERWLRPSAATRLKEEARARAEAAFR